MRKIFITVLLILSFATSAHAEINIVNLDLVELANVMSTPTESPKEIPYREFVEYEVEHLIEDFPVLKKVNWTIYLVPMRASFGSIENLAGLAYQEEGKIFLFSYPKYTLFRNGYDVDYTSRQIKSVVAHEIGHLFRKEFVPVATILDYYTKRFPDNPPGSYPYNPEELFAEDFRILFGSEEAQEISHKLNAPPISETEKSWLYDNVIFFNPE